MKYLYIAPGLLSMAVGAVGVVLPLLPTVPFLLLASFFFAKGSDRFHNWFKSTKLYKNHLESFVFNVILLFFSKLSIVLPVSFMLCMAFLMMHNSIGRATIVVLLIVKYYYFIFKIKTISPVKIEK